MSAKIKLHEIKDNLKRRPNGMTLKPCSVNGVWFLNSF